MHIHNIKISEETAVPLMQSRLSAGFPSPTTDFVEGQLDLNAHLVKRPAATFIVQIMGDSMTGAGIFDGDYAVIDRSLTAENGDIVVAAVNGELTVKRLKRKQNICHLVAENQAYPDIKITAEIDFVIWGVVTSVIHQFRKS